MSQEKIENEFRRIRTLFWDFYILNELWFRIGGGMEAMGYKSDSIFNEKLREKISFKFEDTTEVFFKEVQQAVEQSIRSEMKYPFISSDFNHSDRKDAFASGFKLSALAAFCKTKGFSNRQNAAKAPIEQAKQAFLWEGWNESYCGPAWAKACDSYLESKEISSLKNKIGWIDKALDLYHNEGFLMNKTAFAALTAWTVEYAPDLDRRFTLKKIKDVIPLLEKERKFMFYLDAIDRDIHFVQAVVPLSSPIKNLLLANINKL